VFSPENRAKAEGLVARYPVKRSALLPLLHLVQHQDGHVSDDGIAECAELLDLTKAEVAAVSTFYTMYKREPMGRHLVSVCTNFSCAVRGGEEVYQRVSAHLGVGHDQTTEDGAITLEHAECLGNCEGAPLVTVDYINYEMVGPDAAVELVDALRRGEVPEPTRGMLPPGIREASHRLAGIGPIDPDAPGQRLGLATAEHGAVPVPASGPGIAGGVISFAGTPAGASADGASADDASADGASADDASADDQPDETAAPDGEPVDDLAQEDAVEAAAAAEGVDVARIADQASPSGEDPAVQGAETDDDPAGDR
jgi:NADH-quinone oxidoreductase subunit E